MFENLDWHSIRFAQPYFLVLLLLVPTILWWLHKQQKSSSSVIRLSSTSALGNVPPTMKIKLRPFLTILRTIAVIMFVIVLARPQSSNVTENVESEGIDIVLSLDVSGSMLVEDLRPNR